MTLLATIIQAIIELIPLIARMAREGVSDEEIARRVADPTFAGRGLIEAAAARQQRGRRLLNRKPKGGPS